MSGWRRRESKAKAGTLETSSSGDRPPSPNAQETPSERAIAPIAQPAPEAPTDATVLDGTGRTEPEQPADDDEAIRLAAKKAIDAGNVARAMKLLALLDDRDTKPENVPAEVIDLDARRRGSR